MFLSENAFSFFEKAFFFYKVLFISTAS